MATFGDNKLDLCYRVYMLELLFYKLTVSVHVAFMEFSSGFNDDVLTLSHLIKHLSGYWECKDNSK